MNNKDYITIGLLAAILVIGIVTLVFANQLVNLAYKASDPVLNYIK